MGSPDPGRDRIKGEGTTGVSALTSGKGWKLSAAYSNLGEGGFVQGKINKNNGLWDIHLEGKKGTSQIRTGQNGICRQLGIGSAYCIMFLHQSRIIKPWEDTITFTEYKIDAETVDHAAAGSERGKQIVAWIVVRSRQADLKKQTCTGKRHFHQPMNHAVASNFKCHCPGYAIGT